MGPSETNEGGTKDAGGMVAADLFAQVLGSAEALTWTSGVGELGGAGELGDGMIGSHAEADGDGGVQLIPGQHPDTDACLL